MLKLNSLGGNMWPMQHGTPPRVPPHPPFPAAANGVVAGAPLWPGAVLLHAALLRTGSAGAGRCWHQMPPKQLRGFAVLPQWLQCAGTAWTAEHSAPVGLHGCKCMKPKSAEEADGWGDHGEGTLQRTPPFSPPLSMGSHIAFDLRNFSGCGV